MQFRSFLLATVVMVGGAMWGVAACGTNPSTFGQDASTDDATTSTVDVVQPTFGDVSAEAKPPCTGLECQVQNCGGGVHTTVSGIVYDPAGRNPLYNVYVYVPNAPVLPITTGAVCTACQAPASGSPLPGAVQTDALGKFTVTDVPVGTNIPLVMQAGKFRRQIIIPTVNACVDNPIGKKDTQRPRDDHAPPAQAERRQQQRRQHPADRDGDGRLRRARVLDAQDRHRRHRVQLDGPRAPVSRTRRRVGSGLDERVRVLGEQDRADEARHRPQLVRVLSRTIATRSARRTRPCTTTSTAAVASSARTSTTTGSRRRPARPTSRARRTGCAASARFGRAVVHQHDDPEGRRARRVDPERVEVARRRRRGRSTSRTSNGRRLADQGQDDAVDLLRQREPEQQRVRHGVPLVQHADHRDAPVRSRGLQRPPRLERWRSGAFPSECGGGNPLTTAMTQQETALEFLFFDLSSCVGDDSKPPPPPPPN